MISINIENEIIIIRALFKQLNFYQVKFNKVLKSRDKNANYNKTKGAEMIRLR